MMVDQRRGSGEQRLHGPDQGGRPHRAFVHSAVEPPPHALQDLDEVVRWFECVGHAAREGRVDVRVGADVARDDQTTRTVDARRRVGWSASHAYDPVAVDQNVCINNARRAECRNHPTTTEKHAHGSSTYAYWPVLGEPEATARIGRSAPQLRRGKWETGANRPNRRSSDAQAGP